MTTNQRSCPCNGMAAGGPFSCEPCKRKAATNPGVKTPGGQFPSQTRSEPPDSVRGVSVSAMQGRVIRAFQGFCLPDTRHIRFDPNTNAAAFVRTACHEAAHAVVAQTLGCRVESIFPGPIDGHIQHDAPDTPLVELAIILAGWAGEHLVILPDDAPARSLSGQDALDVDRCLDALGLKGDARRKAKEATVDFDRRCLIAHAEAWDALLWRLVQAPMRPLDGATARTVMATGDPMSTAA